VSRPSAEESARLSAQWPLSDADRRMVAGKTEAELTDWIDRTEVQVHEAERHAEGLRFQLVVLLAEQSRRSGGR